MQPDRLPDCAFEHRPDFPWEPAYAKVADPDGDPGTAPRGLRRALPRGARQGRRPSHAQSGTHSPDDPASQANRAAWKVLSASDLPVLLAFSDSDPITGAGAPILRNLMPGARGRNHPTIHNAGHFLQEDAGGQLGKVIADFMSN